MVVREKDNLAVEVSKPSLPAMIFRLMPEFDETIERNEEDRKQGKRLRPAVRSILWLLGILVLVLGGMAAGKTIMFPDPSGVQTNAPCSVTTVGQSGGTNSPCSNQLATYPWSNESTWKPQPYGNDGSYSTNLIFTATTPVLPHELCWKGVETNVPIVSTQPLHFAGIIKNDSNGHPCFINPPMTITIQVITRGPPTSIKAELVDTP